MKRVIAASLASVSLLVALVAQGCERQFVSCLSCGLGGESGGTKNAGTGGTAGAGSGGDRTGLGPGGADALGGARATGGAGATGGSTAIVEPSLRLLPVRRLHVERDGGVVFPVEVERIGDWTGAVTLEGSGLVPGLALETAVIPAGAVSAEVTVISAGAAAYGIDSFELRATASLLGYEDTQIVDYSVEGAPGTVDNTFTREGQIFPGTKLGVYVPTGLALHSDGTVWLAGTEDLGLSATLRRLSPAENFSLDLAWKGETGSHGGPLALVGELPVFLSDSVGGAFLARAEEDGGIDPSFGDGGQVTLGEMPAGVWSPPSDLAAPEKARETELLVIGGSVPLRKYSRSGLADSEFDFSSDEVPDAVTVDGEGRIVVAWAGTTSYRLSRFDAAGALDVSFGKEGTFELAAPADSELVQSRGLVARPGGGVVLLAHSAFAADEEPFVTEAVLIAVDDTGRLDRSFGGSGRVRLTKQEEIACGLFQTDSGDLLAWTRTRTGSSGFSVSIERFSSAGEQVKNWVSGGVFVPQVVDGLTATPSGVIAVSHLGWDPATERMVFFGTQWVGGQMAPLLQRVWL